MSREVWGRCRAAPGSHIAVMPLKVLLLSCVAILFETSIAAAQRDGSTADGAAGSREDAQDASRSPIEEGPLRTPIAPVAPYAAGLAAWTTALGIGLYSAPWSDGKVDAGWSDVALIDPTLLPEDERPDRSEALMRTVSDATLATTVGYVQLVDIVLVPALQGDVHLVWQATSAHFLALGTTLSIDSIAKHATSRERPYGQRLCPDYPDLPQCNNGDLYASFFSGHTALAFASAGTSCALHLSRSLYGDLLADALGCALPIASATATGALRMASDSHYFTDVLVGAAVGFLSGYLITIAVVPSRVRMPAEGDEVAASTDVAWTIVPTASTSRDGGSIGAAATGMF